MENIDINTLYKKWVRSVGEEKINLKWPSLRGLYNWFLRETERRDIDPATIDFGSFVDYSLTYHENKKILESLMESPLTEKEAERMYEELKGEMQRRAREQYPEILDELEGRIAELEREKDKAKGYRKLVKELKLQLAETERRLEEERVRPPEVAVKIRILKPFTEGIIDYTTGSIVETRDLDWVLHKIEKGFVERVPVEVPVEVVPPPKELSKEEMKRLESEFRLVLRRELGRVPRYALDEFTAETAAFKFLPYEEALKHIERLAKRIVTEEARPPRVKPPPVAPPEIIVPEEFVIIPVELPKEPISPLPFPRAPTTQEKDVFWKHFTYALRRMGKDPVAFTPAMKERINMPFRSWEALLKTYMEFISDIEAGKPLALIPLYRIPMPWREEKEELWRRDAIVHFIATKIYKNMDELTTALYTYGVRPPPTPEEVKEAARKAWKEKNLWFTSVSAEDLAALDIEVD